MGDLLQLPVCGCGGGMLGQLDACVHHHMDEFTLPALCSQALIIGWCTATVSVEAGMKGTQWEQTPQLVNEHLCHLCSGLYSFQYC
jgi:hypothetical protein